MLVVSDMEVILADHLGFCYGVKRAIQLARENAANDGSACTLGPIIHNPQMVARLSEEGVGTVKSLDELEHGTIIIRSHGVGPGIYDEAQQKGLLLIDATCPHVKKAQLSARKLAEAGRQVVIVGEKCHPEVQSICEWAGNDVAVVEDEDEAALLPRCTRMGIVAQTTFSGKRFKQIVMKLLDKADDVHVVRTICTATDQRQKAAMELAGRVDLMLVIGGRNSANTTRLAQLCAEQCRTIHIETAAELHDEWFDKIEKIGITAGASTPDWIIKEVYKKCKIKIRT
jgi:4-hydroxy-3-methylbut-2-enyl diphosphate reductase